MFYFDLSQELITMFINFFNSLLTPFTTNIYDLPFPSFFQDFLDYMMDIFDFNVTGTSILGFMFATGTVFFLIITLFKWAKDIIL